MIKIKTIFQDKSISHAILIIVLTFSFFFHCSSQIEKELDPNASYFSKMYIDKIGCPKLINNITSHRRYKEYYKYISSANQKKIEKYLYNIKIEEWVLDIYNKPLKHIGYNYKGSEDFIINYDYYKGNIFSANRMQNKIYSEIRRYYYDKKYLYITKIIALDRQNKSYQKYVFDYTKDICVLKIYVFSSDKKYIGLHKLSFNKEHNLIEYSQYKNNGLLKRICKYSYNNNDECIRYDEYDEKNTLILYKTFNYDSWKRIIEEKTFSNLNTLTRKASYQFDDYGRINYKEISYPSQNLSTIHEYEYEPEKNRIIEYTYQDDVIISLHHKSLDASIESINQSAVPKYIDLNF